MPRRGWLWVTLTALALAVVTLRVAPTERVTWHELHGVRTIRHVAPVEWGGVARAWQPAHLIGPWDVRVGNTVQHRMVYERHRVVWMIAAPLLGVIVFLGGLLIWWDARRGCRPELPTAASD